MINAATLVRITKQKAKMGLSKNCTYFVTSKCNKNWIVIINKSCRMTFNTNVIYNRIQMKPNMEARPRFAFGMTTWKPDALELNANHSRHSILIEHSYAFVLNGELDLRSHDTMDVKRERRKGSIFYPWILRLYYEI